MIKNRNKKLVPEIKNILVITAMKVETEALLKDRQLQFESKALKINKSPVEVFHAEINGHNVFLVESGAGFVNNSIVISRIIDDFDIHEIISFGIGSSLSKDLKIGDIVLSTSVIHHGAVFLSEQNPRYMSPGKLFLSLSEDYRGPPYINASKHLISILSHATAPGSQPSKA